MLLLVIFSGKAGNEMFSNLREYRGSVRKLKLEAESVRLEEETGLPGLREKRFLPLSRVNYEIYIRSEPIVDFWPAAMLFDRKQTADSILSFADISCCSY